MVEKETFLKLWLLLLSYLM